MIKHLIELPQSLTNVTENQPELFLKDFLPIPKYASFMITGHGGIGKSMLSIQIAIKMIIENPNKKVLLWLSEDPASVSKHRAILIAKNLLDLKESQINKIFKQIDIIGAEKPTILIDKHFLYLAEFIKLFKQYELAIIDPLSGFFGGDENSNSDAKKFMKIINEIVNEAQVSLGIIHHHNKNPNTDIKTRGAVSFINSIRSLYEIENTETISVKKLKLIKDNWNIKSLPVFQDSQDLYINILPKKTVKKGQLYEY